MVTSILIFHLFWFSESKLRRVRLANHPKRPETFEEVLKVLRTEKKDFSYHFFNGVDTGKHAHLIWVNNDIQDMLDAEVLAVGWLNIYTDSTFAVVPHNLDVKLYQVSGGVSS